MSRVSNKLAINLLRLSLGITFFWFGILKLFNASPIIETIKNALPPMLAESQIFLFSLAILEMLLGIAFLVNRFVRLASIIMIVHLLIASVPVLITQGFSPRFPILSLEGEFVIKNLVLIAAGLVILSNRPDQTQ